MLVVVTGISHKTAPLELRDKLALDDEAAVRIGHDLLLQAGLCETVALSTCNRTELYMWAGDSLAASEAALQRLAAEAQVELDELRRSAYSYSGDGAISHLFRVTASLDSMVVGEYQIVSQMKNAYQNACEGGTTSVVFNRLFRRALEVGKRVRTETAIGEKPVSVSSAGVDLALQVFGKFKDHTALIIGAGETSELTATHLKGHGIEHILVTNRTFAAAEELAGRVGGRAVPFEDLEGHLTAADIVISSTSAPHYVVTRERVERAMKHRRHRPIFFIDIAVPRDLDPEINHVDNVFLYDIDDLQHVVSRHVHEREKEAAKAEHIVQEELDEARGWLRSLEVVPTIAMLRETVEDIRRGELDRLANKLSGLTDEQRAQVDMLTSSIVNKILHVPTVRMKEVAGRDECYLYVDALRTLFGLEEEDLDDEAAGGGDEDRRDGEEDRRDGGPPRAVEPGCEIDAGETTGEETDQDRQPVALDTRLDRRLDAESA